MQVIERITLCEGGTNHQIQISPKCPFPCICSPKLCCKEIQYLFVKPCETCCLVKRVFGFETTKKNEKYLSSITSWLLQVFHGSLVSVKFLYFCTCPSDFHLLVHSCCTFYLVFASGAVSDPNRKTQFSSLWGFRVGGGLGGAITLRLIAFAFIEDAMLLDVVCKVQVMPRYWKVTWSNVVYATVWWYVMLTSPNIDGVSLCQVKLN